MCEQTKTEIYESGIKRHASNSLWIAARVIMFCFTPEYYSRAQCGSIEISKVYKVLLLT